MIYGVNTNLTEENFDIRYCWMVQNPITRMHWLPKTVQMTICLASQAVVKKHESRSSARHLPTTLWSDFMLFHKITTPKTTQSILTHFKGGGLEILKSEKTRWCISHTVHLLECFLGMRGRQVNVNGFSRSNCSNLQAKLILRHIETHFHLADYSFLGRDGQTFVGRWYFE